VASPGAKGVAGVTTLLTYKIPVVN
jgi:hypothetical protein